MISGEEVEAHNLLYELFNSIDIDGFISLDEFSVAILNNDY